MNLYGYFERETKHGRRYHRIEDPRRRTERAFGIDKRTLRRWPTDSQTCVGSVKSNQAGRRHLTI